MRKIFFIIFLAAFMLTCCQGDYIEYYVDIETELITFEGITASRDSACMFDTIVLSAHASGENLEYKWQRTKGSLVQVPDDPSKAYFWGCRTCVGDLTVSCTVLNEHGQYTKDVTVFVWPWYKGQKPPENWQAYIDYINNKYSK